MAQLCNVEKKLQLQNDNPTCQLVQDTANNNKFCPVIDNEK